MIMLNVKHILLPAVNCLLILLFANLVSIGIISTKQTISLSPGRIRIKHFWVHYILIALTAIISALIFAALPNSKTLSYLLICWSILFFNCNILQLKSIFVTFRNCFWEIVIQDQNQLINLQ